jgi:23S rRNA pseudouridine2605 synthase
MNQNQLEQARHARWRQDGNALLTLDDAERWLAETPLCLYLPRRQHLPVPAPSFVEAIAGRPDSTPGPEHIAAAAQMLARLVASGAVIALNLFGAAPGIGVSSFVGEHPDFLATPEALPYLYAMQPERNPKRAPTTVGGARVSPLAAEAYKLLEREGALTTIELRTRLGREVTEAAVLRSLAELWHTMRVVPVPAENPPEGAHWELLSARHRRELNIGGTHSQTTALSILVSFYLQSAVSATAEEVEIFLSPLASRSRIHDVVHGLSTTRQLASFSLAGDEQFYVEGTLPEVAEEEETVVLVASAIGEDAGLEQNEPDLTEAAAANPEGISDAISQERPAAPRRAHRPAFADRARGSFAAQDRKAPSSDRRGPSRDRAPRREGGFGRPQRSDSARPERGTFRRAEGAGPRAEGAEGAARPPRPNFERRARPSFEGSSERRARPGGPPRSGTSDRPKRFGAPNRFGASDRREYSASKGKFGGSFGKGRPPRPGGGRFRSDKPAGERPARSGEGMDRPRFRPATGAPSSGARSSRFGQGRPARPARDGERPPRSFGRGEAGGTRPDRPFRKPQGDRPAGGPGRFERRPGGGARPGGSGRPGGSSRPSAFSRPPRRDGESRPPFRGGQSRPQGDRPFKRPYSSAGDRPARRAPGGPPSGTDRPERTFTPRPRPEGASSRPEGGDRAVRPFRPSGQRPGGFSKPGGRPKSFGKPSFGKPPYRKPAGDRPPAGEAGAERPRSPRPAFGSATRPGTGARKPFGKPRPGGAASGRPRPAGAGKGRTSTTTSSGKPRRPGGFGEPGAFGKPGAPGRPPAKGSFGDFKPRGKPSTAKRPATKRPGGFAAPKRKPRTEGDEG